ncbi:MAG TPA: TraR/DksA C4-type zinc finger protein [Bryobacteraceae bacterium]|nr:TraR/DksA C4-type zinc finger protein [Bryobacteraceae bacterium]
MSSHISEVQREVLERLLRGQLAALRQSIAAAREGLPRREHASEELEQDPHDLPQRAGDFEVEAGLSDLDTKQRSGLIGALRRLQGPGFGRCVDCNAGIPFERLVAEPQTERCVACETALARGRAP